MPSIELLPIVRELAPLGLFSIAVAFHLKRRVKAQRPEVPPEELEIHHVRPRYKGGKDYEENLVALRRPEHALEHYKEMVKSKGRDRHANFWAVEQIKKRMSEEEVQEFRQLVSQALLGIREEVK